MLNWFDWMKEYEGMFFGSKLSRWLLLASVVLMGTQMYPGFAALLVMTLNILLLYVMRWVAKREAVYQLINDLDV